MIDERRASTEISVEALLDSSLYAEIIDGVVVADVADDLADERFVRGHFAAFDHAAEVIAKDSFELFVIK